MIKRSIGYSAPVNAKNRLYVSLVRRHLEYCVSVWSGLSKENCLTIELVQRAAHVIFWISLTFDIMSF